VTRILDNVKNVFYIYGSNERLLRHFITWISNAMKSFCPLRYMMCANVANALSCSLKHVKRNRRIYTLFQKIKPY